MTVNRAMTRINLLLARAANGVIGANGALPWHLPEDMAHFKAQTAGAPVVMGRKTWDSLPPRFRPLPGRRNIVVTRQADWREAGAERASDLPQALELAGAVPDIWVIGGAQIFEEAAPYATRAVITEIERDYDGDVIAPTLDSTQWRETARDSRVSAAGVPFSFVTLERIRSVER